LYKHKKSCLRKTNGHTAKRAKLVIAKDGSGSDLIKASIVESNFGTIVKMIAPALEEQGSQTHHIHCQVWLMQLASRVPQSLFQVDSIKQVKSTRFRTTSVQQEMEVLSIQHRTSSRQPKGTSQADHCVNNNRRMKIKTTSVFCQVWVTKRGILLLIRKHQRFKGCLEVIIMEVVWN
jgi:hypothetical protein